MLLGLSTAALVLGALLWELSRPRLHAGLTRARGFVRARRRVLAYEARRAGELDYDPGRERRAEQRARELLRSCVSEREWAMYRDLGFLRVRGRSGERYAYLLYPHKPIVAYVPGTGALLSEYCVAFPDHTRPYGSTRLPDADDVLAKWMALTADERRLIADANMHLPGRQVDPRRVARDLRRLDRWEHERGESRARTAGAVPAGASRASAAADGTPAGSRQTPARSGRMLPGSGSTGSMGVPDSRARRAGLGAGSVRAA